jgi:hypothetical protein
MKKKYKCMRDGCGWTGDESETMTVGKYKGGCPKCWRFGKFIPVHESIIQSAMPDNYEYKEGQQDCNKK